MKMKKKYLYIGVITFVFACFIFLTGCELLKNVSDQLECEHDYNIISSTATCEKNGEKKYVYTKCNKEMVVKVKAEGHKFEVLSEVPATCSKSGEKVEKCQICEFEHTVEIAPLPHTYHEIERVDSTCKDKGYILNKCSVCEHEEREDIDLKGHKFGEWIETIKASEEHDGVLTKTCEVCGKTEEKHVKFLEDLDLSIITYNFEDKNEYTVNSFEELVLVFNSAILNLKSKVFCNLKFEIDDVNAMLKKLFDAKTVPFDYKVSASASNGLLSGTKLVLDFEYFVNPTKSTPQIKKYIQRDSLNYTTITSSRSDDFDGFKINSSKYSYGNITSTEQLVYCLERRVKPICVSGSKADLIYKEIKKVLREIIDDSMSDVEKMRAIHDWIIMNVTYDQELCDLLYEGATDLKSYKGFYLEGVFENKNAVCEGISKALCVMANIEGIPCVRVSGHKTSDPNGVGHAWNKAYIDEDWYIVDATSDGTIIGGEYEVLSYAYFMISDATMKRQYTGEEYETYVCSKDYDIYEDQVIVVNENEYKLSVKSREELTKVFLYLKDNGESRSTLQIYLNYEFSDLSDELRAASLKALYLNSYSQITDGKIVMIVK